MKSKYYPVQDIIEWDVANWAVLMALWTPLIDKLPKEAKVLAIGERNGGLSTWLALKGFNVWCTDRVYPTNVAIENHRKYGVAEKMTYATYDVVAGDDTFHEQFDLVIAKSVIGGLKTEYANPLTRNFEVQKNAVGNIYKCLKPGGHFLSAENMDGGVPGRAIRRITGKNSGWRYLRWKELGELFSLFELVQAKAFGTIPGIFANRQLQSVIYFINAHLLRLLPPSYKYIAFVTARKP